MSAALPHPFWIYLARSTDRRARIERRFEERAIAHTRIEGVDGADAAAVDRSIRWSKTTAREAACIASHLTAIRAAFETGHDRALVVEDDTTFEPFDRFPDLWAEVDAALPPRFGIVALTIAQRPKDLDRHFARRGAVVRLARTGFWSTGAYVIERIAMQRLLQRFARGDSFDVRSHRLRHDAYSLLMRSWGSEADVDGPWVARVPLFSYEGEDSEIHPHHLDEHRVSRAFVHAHFERARRGPYARTFGVARLVRRLTEPVLSRVIGRGLRASSTE